MRSDPRRFLGGLFGKPKPWNNEIAPGVRTWQPDENGYRINVDAAPLMARPVTCSGCSKGTGTLVKVREGTYAHPGCKARVASG